MSLNDTKLSQCFTYIIRSFSISKGLFWNLLKFGFKAKILLISSSVAFVDIVERWPEIIKKLRYCLLSSDFQVFSDVLSPSLLKLPIEIVQDKKMHLFNKSHISALEQVTPLAVEKGFINSQQETVSQYKALPLVLISRWTYTKRFQ